MYKLKMYIVVCVCLLLNFCITVTAVFFVYSVQILQAQPVESIVVLSKCSFISSMNLQTMEVIDTQDVLQFMNMVPTHHTQIEETMVAVVEQPEFIQESTMVVSDEFVIPDGTYNYCPSVIQTTSGIGMFYCSNVNSYQISDNICYSDFTCQNDGSIVLKNRNIVLEPTSCSWDSVHVCDPSVISGCFSYQGCTYQYLMAYLGCNTTDNQKNQIGLAVSNSLSNGWVKVGQSPIIACNYDDLQSGFQWGVGQPSMLCLDNGHIVIFYTEGTYDLTCTKAQEWDFSNLDSPILITQSVVANNGTGDFISNADFAMVGDMLYMVCDKHPFGGNVLNIVADESCIYSCSWKQNVDDLGFISWDKVCTISSDVTGYQKNHNCGLYRTLSGRLADNNVVYTATNEAVDFLSSLYQYRLRYFSY